jgi:S-adenosylmethionine decarboxylase
MTLLTDLREVLVEVTGRPGLRELPADAPLFRDGAGLDSLTGVRLLAAVYDRYGVDVAADDLSLASLASLQVLAGYLTTHRAAHRAAPVPKMLYAVDATSSDDSKDGSSALHDVSALAGEARAAVTEAGGHVLAENHVVFPNGAVTLVMILAESHLSIHTWPEERLVAVDLFSCGTIDGRAVLERLVRRLALTEVRTREIPRG